MNPLVSIIITTRNEEKFIRTLLLSIDKQDYKNIEVLLIDNNSDDRTKKIAKSLRATIYNYGPERSAQRNFGAKKAKGKYLLFLDADMQLSGEVIKVCVSEAEGSHKIDALVIPEKSIAKNFWEKVKAFERMLYNLENYTVIDAARFIKRKTFLKIGGYDEMITGPEDWDLTEKIKDSGYLISTITAHLYHREKIDSLYELAKKKYYYALRAYRYLSKHQFLLISPRTIYFLRPVFYKNWKLLLKNPRLTAGLSLMLIFEQIGGAFGYLYGRITKQ